MEGVHATTDGDRQLLGGAAVSVENIFLKLDELQTLLRNDDLASEAMVASLVAELGTAAQTDVFRQLQEKMSITDYEGALTLLPKIRQHLSSLK